MCISAFEFSSIALGKSYQGFWWPENGSVWFNVWANFTHLRLCLRGDMQIFQLMLCNNFNHSTVLILPHRRNSEEEMRHQNDQKKSPNVYKSCPKWCHLKKDRFWYLYKNYLRRFGQINCCRKLLKVAQSPINRPIWSHCAPPSNLIQVFNFHLKLVNSCLLRIN